MDKVQTLFFRTRQKTTTLYSNLTEREIISDFSFDKVSTVGIRDGYYEIMVTYGEKARPVARLPISCTNMIILDE